MPGVYAMLLYNIQHRLWRLIHFCFFIILTALLWTCLELELRSRWDGPLHQEKLHILNELICTESSLNIRYFKILICSAGYYHRKIAAVVKLKLRQERQLTCLLNGYMMLCFHQRLVTRWRWCLRLGFILGDWSIAVNSKLQETSNSGITTNSETWSAAMSMRTNYLRLIFEAFLIM